MGKRKNLRIEVVGREVLLKIEDYRESKCRESKLPHLTYC
jgi:hypothetical protein